MITHSLPISSILTRLQKIYCNHLKCIYLKNQTFFFDISLHFQNLHKILNHLKKDLDLTAEVFPKLFSPKRQVVECIAGPVSKHPSAVNMLTGTKDCLSQQESTFIVIFQHCDIDRATKRPYYSDLKS